MFYKAILIIFIISFILSLVSLKKINKQVDIEKIKKKLNKSRVIYQNKDS